MTKPSTGPARLVLRRYRLTDRLAVGGSAEVWRAHDEQLGRDVAVKLLHPHLLTEARTRERLAAEARAVAGLSHPGIVAVYDVDVDGEAPGVVLELVEGESLAARLARDESLPPDEAARIAAEVGEALLHAHQRGVVHRDVKPGNILLEPDGRARLVDFGIARTLDEAAERLTMTGTVMGTLRYMAPEQLAGGVIGPKADVWGLGAVLHEMLTGRAPFAAATPVALADEQRNGLAELPGLDPSLVQILRACLAGDPAARPRHVGAVADALRAWLGGDAAAPALLFPAAASSWTDDTVTADQPVVDPGPLPAVSAAPQRTAPSWLLIGALLAVVLLVAAQSWSQQPAGTGGVPSPTASPTSISATPSPTATPLPTVLDLGTLPKPVREEVEQYREACGADAPLPPDLASMNKKDAEEHFKPLREACEGDD